MSTLASKIKKDVAMMLASEGRSDAWFAEYEIADDVRDAARREVSDRVKFGV